MRSAGRSSPGAEGAPGVAGSAQGQALRAQLHYAASIKATAL
jgi:hypothetical protein